MSFSSSDSTDPAGQVAGDKNAIQTATAAQTLTLSLTGAQASGAALAVTGGSGGNNGAGAVQIDTLGYQGIAVELTSLGTGATSVTLRASNDGVTWNPVLYGNAGTGNANPGTSISSTSALYNLAEGFRYYQFTLTAAQTAGTTTFTVCLKAAPSWSPVISLGSGGQVIGSVGVIASTSSQGSSLYSNTALSNTAVAVKSSQANVFGYTFFNPSAAVAYVQFFNLAQGSVTVGTTTPTAVVGIAAGQTVDVGLTVPEGFATALTIAATTTPTGGTAPATALVAKVRYI